MTAVKLPLALILVPRAVHHLALPVHEPVGPLT
jgi:hypothetical protein